MKHLYIILTLTSLFILNSNLFSQTYVNKEWESTTGSVGTINRTASVLDNNENLIVVSNTLNTPNNTDVLITKYDPDGLVLWQTTFDGATNGDDYAVQVKVNSTNDIFVASTIYGTSSNDFGILKYSENGILLWSNTWNGSANGIDVPADLDIDNIGNVYLVGVTEATNNLSDYAIVKFNSTGTYVWNTTYDYNHLHDGASSLKFDDNSVIVTGASASTTTEWDFATLKIDATNGAILNTERTIVAGVGLDNALAVTTDINNNIYITGYVEINGNTNIQTVKLNNTFGLEWVKNFDGGFEDIAKAIGVDDFGNVYITGSTENENGGKDCITIKYDNNGTLNWSKKYGSSGGSNIAKAEKLAISNNGDIVVVGTIDEKGDKDFLTIKYDSKGDKKLSKKYDFGNLDDEAKSVSIKNDDIYVSGIAKIGAQKLSTTVKYSIKDKPSVIVSSNGIAYNQNEVIIRFNKTQINTSAIDKKSFVAGNLSDFVNANGLADLAQATEIGWSNFPTYKIHRRMTTADSVSVSRSGKIISIPAHWATLSVFVPTNSNIESIIDDINTNATSICFAEKNYSYSHHTSTPNDTLFSDKQIGLNETPLFEDAHINIVPAWKFQVGKSYIKVGVIDVPIYWKHKDFGDGTFEGSVIKGGWDYLEDDSIKNTLTAYSSHGTSCGGIIGSLRNNQIGISGIAGGNIDSSQAGVSLYSLGVSSSTDSTSLDGVSIICAILESSCSNPETNFGFGVHIQSNSYGSKGYSQAESEAIETAWRNETVFVASRGNGGKDTIRYPSCYSDKMVISVGASGTDGEIANDIYNGDYNFSSSYGHGMDLIAPGVTKIVSAPFYFNKPYYWNLPLCNVNTPEYSCFNGSSAAAPHVAGVAALLLSQHNTLNWYNNNLAPEDVEYLLESYASDRDTLGYDNKTGWGLLNAGNAMKHITGHYRIEHNSIGSTTSALLGSNVTVVTTKEFNSLPSGTYVADKYLVTKQYDENFGANAIIEKAWIRNSDILGFDASTSNTISSDYSYNTFTSNQISANHIKVTSKLYCYYIPSLNKWIPESPSNIRAAFSMHIYDIDWTSIEDIEQDFNFNLFPNPTDNILNIQYSFNSKVDLQIDMYNNLGQVVYQNIFLKTQKDTKTIDVSSFAKGFYYVNLYTKYKNTLKKVIIK